MPAGAVIIKDQFAEHVLDMAVFPTRPPFTNVDGYGIICAVQTAKPFTLRILYNVRESGIVQLSIGRQRAAPAYRPGHGSKIAALRLF